MGSIAALGKYLPGNIVGNDELARRLNCAPEWIAAVSGIEERRYAGPDETVAHMAAEAAKHCLERKAIAAVDLGMLLVASGSAERRFPGPASEIAHRLGLTQTPAIDIPMASVGALFGMVLANQLSPAYGNILVIAAEKMSAIALRKPLDKNTSILFGDGAGACLIGSQPGLARIVDSVIHSDGAFATDLQLDHEGPLQMNGLSVIIQASRKIPASIAELLQRNGKRAKDIDCFLMHQANQNLINRVARALDVPPESFFSNIRRYGNTSAASMLIAASDWWDQNRGQSRSGASICFAAFGAGFHWGALLAELS